MMMTLRRLSVYADRARSKLPGALSMLEVAVNQRAAERGPSKLARRMQRKRALGLAGAF